MLCDRSNLHKQKLVKLKPLASKMAGVKKVGQKNGEVGLLVECLFCDDTEQGRIKDAWGAPGTLVFASHLHPDNLGASPVYTLMRW